MNVQTYCPNGYDHKMEAKKNTSGKVFVEKPKLFEAIVNDIDLNNTSAKFHRYVSDEAKFVD